MQVIIERSVYNKDCKPFKDIKINRSAMVELTFKPQAMKGWSIAASFALDRGDLYGNNYGGLLTVKGEKIFNIGKEEKRREEKRRSQSVLQRLAGRMSYSQVVVISVYSPTASSNG